MCPNRRTWAITPSCLGPVYCWLGITGKEVLRESNFFEEGWSSNKGAAENESTAETMDLNRNTSMGLIMADQSSFISAKTNRRAHGLGQGISSRGQRSKIQSMEQRFSPFFHLRILGMLTDNNSTLCSNWLKIMKELQDNLKSPCRVDFRVVSGPFYHDAPGSVLCVLTSFPG